MVGRWRRSDEDFEHSTERTQMGVSAKFLRPIEFFGADGEGQRRWRDAGYNTIINNICTSRAG